MCTTCGCANSQLLINGRKPRASASSMPLHFRPPVSNQNIIKLNQIDKNVLPPPSLPARRLRLEHDLLAKNDQLAAANRQQYAAQHITALNLVSSPGSGKTTLLVKTIESLRNEMPIVVIEGDQQTELDAKRIRAAGAPAVQINTGKGCHLDAAMVAQAMQQLQLQTHSLLLIENVGNLVCPAAFDLGEAYKVVILSVTEGEDKPLKYPDMFRAADVMLLNKCDLLPYIEFDAELAIRYALQINPALKVFSISATRGNGMPDWLDWLRSLCAQTVAS